jgi:hypothetical protein
MKETVMKVPRVLAALVLFGIAFGYVEAAVVVYLRGLCEPLRTEFLAGGPHDEVFPLLTLDQLRAAGSGATRLLGVELGRELGTLVMLAATGLAVGRTFAGSLAAFLVAFGVWDIFYYVFLKLLVQWPASLATWDILFLVPVPWVGPVIAPVIVSMSMIAAGAAVVYRESLGRPVPFRWFHWTAIGGGGLTVVVAFCWDWQNTASGGWPNPFHWQLFAAGELLGAGAFLAAWWRRPESPRSDLSS